MKIRVNWVWQACHTVKHQPYIAIKYWYCGISLEKSQVQPLCHHCFFRTLFLTKTTNSIFPSLNAAPRTPWKLNYFLLFCIWKFHFFYEIFNLAAWRSCSKCELSNTGTMVVLLLKIAKFNATNPICLHIQTSKNHVYFDILFILQYDIHATL